MKHYASDVVGTLRDVLEMAETLEDRRREDYSLRRDDERRLIQVDVPGEFREAEAHVYMYGNPDGPPVELMVRRVGEDPLYVVDAIVLELEEEEPPVVTVQMDDAVDPTVSITIEMRTQSLPAGSPYGVRAELTLSKEGALALLHALQGELSHGA